MVDKIIKLKEKQIESLKELKRNRRFLERDYYVLREDNVNYLLVHTATSKLVKMDKLERINSYLRLRDMFDKTIFDFNISLRVRYKKNTIFE